MNTLDPNAPQDPEPEPQPQPEPEQAPVPQYDIEEAYQRVAQHQGWDPRLTQYELNEIKRKREELDRERRELEAERNRRYEPPEDTSDPYMRRISNLERILMEEREEKRREREQAAQMRRIEGEISSAYTSVARQMGMTREQMEKGSTDFYETLAEMYPAHSMIQEIGAERAARNAFRIMSTNGTRPAAGVNRVNPRERVMIPSPQTGPGPGAPAAFDAASQRENETNEQYLERLTRFIRENNITLSSLPEGRKFSSG